MQLTLKYSICSTEYDWLFLHLSTYKTISSIYLYISIYLHHAKYSIFTIIKKSIYTNVFSFFYLSMYLFSYSIFFHLSMWSRILTSFDSSLLSLLWVLFLSSLVFFFFLLLYGASVQILILPSNVIVYIELLHVCVCTKPLLREGFAKPLEALWSSHTEGFARNIHSYRGGFVYTYTHFSLFFLQWGASWSLLIVGLCTHMQISLFPPTNTWDA